MGSNIVHQYFKKEIEGTKIMIKVDPIRLIGIELIVAGDGKVEARSLEFDQQIFDDLKVDGFEEASPLEFNLYHAGVI